MSLPQGFRHHRNGHGLVSVDAFVDPTAYVGKRCRVDAGCRVGSGASLYGRTLVTGSSDVGRDVSLRNLTVHRSTVVVAMEYDGDNDWYEHRLSLTGSLESQEHRRMLRLDYMAIRGNGAAFVDDDQRGEALELFIHSEDEHNHKDFDWACYEWKDVECPHQVQCHCRTECSVRQRDAELRTHGMRLANREGGVPFYVAVHSGN